MLLVALGVLGDLVVLLTQKHPLPLGALGALGAMMPSPSTPSGAGATVGPR